MTITASNDVGYSSKTYKLFIDGIKPLISNDVLPDATVNEPYEFQLEYSGSEVLEWYDIGAYHLTDNNFSGLRKDRFDFSCSPTGLISGTPTIPGNAAIYVALKNPIGYARKTYYIFVNGTKPVINFDKLPEGKDGQYYKFSLSSSSIGLQNTQYLLKGTLPYDLKLDRWGVLEGVPFKSGTFPVTIVASNDVGYDEKNFNLIINGIKPEITTSELKTATAESYYREYIQFSGSEPATWKYEGTLPEGISLNGNYLSGTTKQTGKFPLKITVSNSAGSDTKNLELFVNGKKPVIDKNYYYYNKNSTSYSVFSNPLTIHLINLREPRFKFSGTEPIKWTYTGTLPEGISLKDGILSGKPKKSGEFPIVICASNDWGHDTIDITLKIGNVRPIIQTTELKQGKVGISYSHTLESYGADVIWTASGLPSGLTLNETIGKISGKPKKGGTFTINITATNPLGTLSKSLPLVIEGIKISGDINAKGVVKKSYSSAISVSGGTSPYTWTNTGTLPAGLELVPNSKGTKLTIKGTPTTAKTYNFTLKVTDKNKISISQKFTITVTKPVISGDITAKGVVKKSYSSSITISGGTSPYTWAKNSGTLPAGLTLNPNSTGSKLTLKGTPTTAKAYTFTLKATDKNGATASKKFTVTITKPVISGDITASGVIKKSYSSSITISGGTSPYTWVKSSGTLPAGITLNPNSTGTKLTLKGIPTTAKAYTFTLKATDKNGATASKKFTVTITKPVISGDITANGVVKKSYSSAITISGGTSPYVWTHTGTLPAGLTINSNSTGTKLTIKGTPTTAKAYTFTLKATDKNGATASKKFTVTITKPTISGTLSDSGTIKSSYSSSISVSKGTSPYKWVKSKGTLPAGLKLTTNSTGTKLYLKGTPTTAKAYTFTLKVTDKNGATASKAFTVTIAKANTNKSGESAENISKNAKDFSNIQDVALPDVTVIPDAGSTYVPQGLTELKISGDILWQGEGKNEDLIGVQANEPLTFILENAPSDMQVIIDDKVAEEIEIDEGSFTLPAEFVSDDFKVRAENDEIETNEILISVEK